MLNLYERNGLAFWTEEEILLRQTVESIVTANLKQTLLRINSAFAFCKVEAPILTPFESINPNYSAEDYYQVKGFALRPETTMGSYAAAKHLLSGYSKPKYRMPIVVYQHGKSFRQEQDQPSVHIRLKEFYQLEYQIIYSPTTGYDYGHDVIDTVQRSLNMFVPIVEIIPSDRLPDYSESTTDLMAQNGDTGHTIEVCSISRRKDFEGAKVLEVAIGTDRVVECNTRIHTPTLIR